MPELERCSLILAAVLVACGDNSRGADLASGGAPATPDAATDAGPTEHDAGPLGQGGASGGGAGCGPLLPEADAVCPPQGVALEGLPCSVEELTCFSGVVCEFLTFKCCSGAFHAVGYADLYPGDCHTTVDLCRVPIGDRPDAGREDPSVDAGAEADASASPFPICDASPHSPNDAPTDCTLASIFQSLIPTAPEQDSCYANYQCEGGGSFAVQCSQHLETQVASCVCIVPGQGGFQVEAHADPDPSEVCIRAADECGRIVTTGG